MEKSKIRVIYEYEFRRGTTVSETARNINAVFGEGSTTKATVGNWFKNFKDGDFSLANEPRGRPKTKVDNDHLRAVVESDPSQRCRRNLMLVAQIEKKNKRFTLENGVVTVIDRQKNKAILQARRVNNLYVVRADVVNSDNKESVQEHFEGSQIEQGRADGKKRLIPFAVPTIFNVFNAPKLLNPPRNSLYKRSREEDQCNNVQPNNKRLKVDVLSDCANLTPPLNISNYSNDLLHEDVSESQNMNPDDQILELKKKCAQLEEEIKSKNDAIAKLLTHEQLQTLLIEKKCITKWSHEGIIKGLKLRFALAKTVESMQDIEKDCSLMVDEMDISGDLDFDK
ncbi:hypothetical protein DMN91_005003 [Ooceraea biroi]|uniref:Mos1 transposase HTH domain-containing protein n=1 Tax=Ooceraea biroi TaxID=2015173 RepID=A0A3L8DQL0_OOCBI|nr:hypothetical protein DMN91_005003 [Ooceraea biroi]